MELTKKLQSQVKNTHMLHASEIGSASDAVRAATAAECDTAFVYSSTVLGVPQIAALLPICDSNQVVLQKGNEVIPLLGSIPAIAGVCGTEPFKLMDYYLDELRQAGFVGIQNFPTVGIVDGSFRTNLEATRMGFKEEIRLIERAAQMEMLTFSYVFDQYGALRMAGAGADFVIYHFGARRCDEQGRAICGDRHWVEDQLGYLREIVHKENSAALFLAYGIWPETQQTLREMAEDGSRLFDGAFLFSSGTEMPRSARAAAHSAPLCHPPAEASGTSR